MVVSFSSSFGLAHAIEPAEIWQLRYTAVSGPVNSVTVETVRAFVPGGFTY
jgi:hypothetical protein